MKTSGFNKLLDAIGSAWTGVITHKLRSILTMLGIVIGVGAVITLMAVGKGTTQEILSSIQSMGSNLVTINSNSMMGRSVMFFGGGAMSMSSSNSNLSTGLTQQDADAIASEIDNVAMVATSSSTNQQLIYGSTDMYSSIIGVTPSYREIQDIELSIGSFINQNEYERSARVAVIGAYVAQTLFSGQEPVGQIIRMGSTVFTVIGVLESSGDEIDMMRDSLVYIPLSTLQQTFSKSKTAQGEMIVSSISLLLTDEEHSEQVVTDITALLRERHGLTSLDSDDFSITSMSDIIAAFEETSAMLSLLLGAIAGISLLVGGIGVMNIMLVSVLERTREIGIRKALGARQTDIWSQFLIEASILTLGGGLIGVAAGWGIAYLLNAFEVMTTLVTVDVVLLALGVSVAIGLFFGFYPAWNASRLNPIEALRSE